MVLKPNTMEIQGVENINGGIVSSRNDHRIAMMAAILGTKATEDIYIENPDAINKSYPTFYKDIENIAK